MPKVGRRGDHSRADGDSHGCPVCPHHVDGPAIEGSTNVLINGLGALRVGDRGSHQSCCGQNTWEAVKGDKSVLVNGRPIHRCGDAVQHCGVLGSLSTGSETVRAGERGGQGAKAAQRCHWFQFRIQHANGLPVVGARISIIAPDEQLLEVFADALLVYEIDDIQLDGEARVRVSIPYRRKRYR